MSENEKDAIELASDITPNTGGQTEHEAAQAEVTPVPTPPKAELLAKDPSPLHWSLALYIEEKTGLQISAHEVKVVQLVLALHGEHQQSPEWKARKAQAAAEKQVELAKLAKAKQEKVAKVRVKQADKIGAAIDAGIKLLEAGVPLEETMMVALRAAAEARGIVLPGDEAKPEPEAKEDSQTDEEFLKEHFSEDKPELPTEETAPVDVERPKATPRRTTKKVTPKSVKTNA